MEHTDKYKKFIENSKLWAIAYLEGNDKIANKIYKSNEKILLEFKDNLDFYKDKLLSTVDDQNRGIRYWTASVLIRLEIDVDKGFSIIHELAIDNTDGSLKSIALLSERYLLKKIVMNK